MKNRIKKLFNLLGLEISRYNPIPLEKAKAINPQQKGANFLKMLTYHDIDLVLDVGANKGQFAQHLLAIGYQGKIISFEPLSSAYQLLLENSQLYNNWIVAEKTAIGNQSGEIEINIANNSESSSILPMLKAHLDAAPRSAYVEAEKVKISKLDEIINQYLEAEKNILLKIDTQGYEEQVLNGAKNLIPRLQGIHLELSLVPLYEGQATFNDMLNKIQNLGFSLYSISPGFRDYRTGRLLQVMGTFFRRC